MVDSHAHSYGRRLTGLIARHLRVTMIRGLLLLVPVMITYVVLKWLFDALMACYSRPVRRPSTGVCRALAQ